MKGDFTRSTFDPRKHYSGVRMQQGRVQLDADWNEQVDIQSYLLRQSTKDLWGPSCAPFKDRGFEITVDGNGSIIIGTGRYYVDGILCENEEDVEFLSQPDPPLETLPDDPGQYLAYLDVWDRHVTAVEDEGILEKALGGIDTATRTKTVWQVKLQRFDGGVDCATSSDRLEELLERTSRLSVSLNPEGAAGDCEISAGGVYKGYDNRLYRVEVHQPGVLGEATFKWSKDNGSTVFAIESFLPVDASDEISSCYKVRVKSLGTDRGLDLKVGDWVEVLGDMTELSGKPGTMAQVESIDESSREMTLSEDLSAHRDEYWAEYHPKLRRWDSEVMPTSADWTELENCINVCFNGEDKYETGDYWQIPARTTGEIEWPPGQTYEGEAYELVDRFGVYHHRCSLAILGLDQDQVWTELDDCRRLAESENHFHLFYAGGDGQEGMPGEILPGSLAVRVYEGGLPTSGMKVKFEIEETGGVVYAGNLIGVDPGGEPLTGKTLEVTPDPEGFAKCQLQLAGLQGLAGGPYESGVKVTATLIDVENLQYPKVYFSEFHSLATRVRYWPSDCTLLADAVTVKDALDTLCDVMALNFCYHGGDGQEGMPGEVLPYPLMVGVTKGDQPFPGAEVKFEIVGVGVGALLSAGGSPSQSLTVPTDPSGIASCYLQLLDEDPTVTEVEVTATLQGVGNYPPIHFNAGVSLATRVRYLPSDCTLLANAVTVNDAIDTLCDVLALDFSYIGGDGQEGMPGEVLPYPLMVGVTKGDQPFPGGEVKFEIVEAGVGTLLSAGGNSSQSLTVPTDPSGIARCDLQLLVDPAGTKVEVTATLQGVGNYPPVHFNAGVNLGIQTVSVHGYGFQMVDRSGLAVNLEGGFTRVERVGEGDPSTFVHLALPAPVNINARNISLKGSSVRLRGEGASVLEVHLYEGDNEIYSSVVEIVAGADWSDHLFVLQNPQPLVRGVGMSIRVSLEQVPGSHIDFASASFDLVEG